MEGRGFGQKCHWAEVPKDNTSESTPLSKNARAPNLKDLSQKAKGGLGAATLEGVVAEKKKYKQELGKLRTTVYTPKASHEKKEAATVKKHQGTVARLKNVYR